MEKRRYKHRMIIFFKMIKNMAPPYLENLIPPSVHQVSQRNLRNFSDLRSPKGGCCSISDDLSCSSNCT